MKNHLRAALMALVTLLPATALAQMAVGYQDQVSNHVTLIPVTPANPLPTAAYPPGAAASAAITPAVSAVASTSLIAKAAPGNYYDGYCQSSAAGRCILYNSTTVPGAGALTASLVLECAIVPAGGSAGWSYPETPRRATVGVVLLMSTGADCNTYTASSTAYIHASVQ